MTYLSTCEGIHHGIVGTHLPSLGCNNVLVVFEERWLRQTEEDRIGKKDFKLTHFENSRSSSTSTKGMNNSFVRVERFIMHDRMLLTYTD
ncbi:hypothetical protein MKW98_028845 [Papaver atlanticum]|uniref:Uncharacterized protein n=1 Tax=Papaver atlanticum TaxID=357466 RepID=A0AAD4S3T6_9MAGN|nr:hypothetical protein MKW98_028845 [Papaver atlanticum]